jgi:hypothetical protein
MTAIGKIGEPIDERTNVGRRVYIWGTFGAVNRGEKGKCQITATMDGDIVASFDYEGDELRAVCRAVAAVAIRGGIFSISIAVAALIWSLVSFLLS